MQTCHDLVMNQFCVCGTGGGGGGGQKMDNTIDLYMITQLIYIWYIPVQYNKICQNVTYCTYHTWWVWCASAKYGDVYFCVNDYRGCE